jgi:hypothetical protein
LPPSIIPFVELINDAAFCVRNVLERQSAMFIPTKTLQLFPKFPSFWPGASGASMSGAFLILVPVVTLFGNEDRLVGKNQVPDHFVLGGNLLKVSVGSSDLAGVFAVVSPGHHLPKL